MSKHLRLLFVFVLAIVCAGWANANVSATALHTLSDVDSREDAPISFTSETR